MKKGFIRYIYLSILIYIVLITGCSSIVLIEFKTAEIAKTSIDVQEWIKSLEDKKGVFVSKKEINEENEEYYIYSNKMLIRELVLTSASSDGLKVTFNTKESTSGDDKVYIITTKNKKAKYILFNNRRIDTGSILVVSTLRSVL